MKGDLFVNKECIACEMCVCTSPDNFAMKKERAYVKKQPSGKVEKFLCSEARKHCPVESIKCKIK